MAAKDSAGMWKGNKRPFESEDGKETADPEDAQEPKAKGRKTQPESDTEYHAVPKDVDYRKCADVGYQDAIMRANPTATVCACICRMKTGA